jgi:hypothetical protein
LPLFRPKTIAWKWTESAMWDQTSGDERVHMLRATPHRCCDNVSIAHPREG